MQAYFVAVAIITLIYMLLTLGLNLHYGYTGLINFGHVAFYAIGAYTSALLTLLGWPIWAGCIMGISLAAVASFPIGLLSLRLREEYFAIVTLGFSEFIRIVIANETWLTRGVQGIPGIPRPFISLGVTTGSETAFLALLLILNVAVVAIIYRITTSPFGRVIEAIRDDEDAVQALGKDPANFKIRVLMIGAGIAGLAGALQAHYITYISPDEFTPLLTFYIWIAMIIGGTGRVSGAIVGTGILMFFLEGSRFLRDFFPGIPEVKMASLRLAAVGLALILFTLYRPSGLMGHIWRK
jgi:branched-chain amino acid transport system permease protein